MFSSFCNVFFWNIYYLRIMYWIDYFSSLLLWVLSVLSGVSTSPSSPGAKLDLKGVCVSFTCSESVGQIVFFKVSGQQLQKLTGKYRPSLGLSNALGLAFQRFLESNDFRTNLLKIRFLIFWPFYFDSWRLGHVCTYSVMYLSCVISTYMYLCTYVLLCIVLRLML